MTHSTCTNISKALLIIGSLLFASTASMAEQKVEFNGYEMHYIVLNTMELPVNVAEIYDIKRSRKRAFINLSILKQTDDGYGTPTSASINAVQRTLLGQRSPIDLQEIREGDAIYYIGHFNIFDQEMLWFDVELTVNNGPTFEYSFSQKVWRE
jgi:hypothetical protein